MSLSVQGIRGVFDTALGRLVGIIPDSVNDVTNIATVQTNPLTGEVIYSGGGSVLNLKRTTPLRISTFGDSRANVSGIASTDLTVISTAVAATAIYSIQSEKWQLPAYYKQAYLVANGGRSGELNQFCSM